MTVEIPQVLGGPILQWELVRGARLLWPKMLRYGYWLLLVVVLCAFAGTSQTEIAHGEEGLRLLAERTALAQQVLFFLLCQQLVLILLLTPAVTAGALGHEKERGTLAALFGTELSSRQIVTGKLLGRLAVLGHTGLAGLPALLFLAVLSELGIGRLLLALAQVAVLTFFLASVSLLCSVWTRRTSDAILACYATIVLGFIVVMAIGGEFWLPDWLNPVEMLLAIGQPGAPVPLMALALHLTAWVAVGFACLALAVAQLRSACLNQLEKRPGRWLWAFRPRVADDPVRWRERFVLGLAPLPWLRGVPTWMALLGVFSFSAILAGTSLDAMVPGFFQLLREGHWERAYAMLQHPLGERVGSEIAVSGVILVLLGVPVVGVRCATSIKEEKRRKTWEDLVLTPLPLEQILWSKMWGVLQAAFPYVAIYALPMFGVATLGGALAVFWAAVWVVGASLAFVAAGVAGKLMSSDDAYGFSALTGAEELAEE
jgi:ABC-type Na+ efflux pump permease subunit